MVHGLLTVPVFLTVGFDLIDGEDFFTCLPVRAFLLFTFVLFFTKLFFLLSFIPFRETFLFILPLILLFNGLILFRETFLFILPLILLFNGLTNAPILPFSFIFLIIDPFFFPLQKLLKPFFKHCIPFLIANCLAFATATAFNPGMPPVFTIAATFKPTFAILTNLFNFLRNNLRFEGSEDTIYVSFDTLAIYFKERWVMCLLFSCGAV